MGFLDWLKKFVGKGREPEQTLSVDGTDLTVKVYGGEKRTAPSPVKRAAAPTPAPPKKSPVKTTKPRGKAKRFGTKVAGVSFEDRQTWVKGCRVGQPVVLLREPNNPHDGNAIGVWVETSRGRKQVGFIREGVNIELAEKMDRGWLVGAKVLRLTGLEAGQSKGLVIEVSVAPKP